MRPSRAIVAAACAATLGLAACTGSSPRFTPAAAPHMQVGGEYSASEEGMASYYADEFHGRKTSNGEVFDMDSLTAAHRSFPFGTKVRVTNLNNNRTVTVRINDRGPFVEGRIIDLSRAGAEAIGMIGTGTAPVRLEVIEFGPDSSKPAK